MRKRFGLRNSVGEVRPLLEKAQRHHRLEENELAGLIAIEKGAGERLAVPWRATAKNRPRESLQTSTERLAPQAKSFLAEPSLLDKGSQIVYKLNHRTRGGWRGRRPRDSSECLVHFRPTPGTGGGNVQPKQPTCLRHPSQPPHPPLPADSVAGAPAAAYSAFCKCPANLAVFVGGQAAEDLVALKCSRRASMLSGCARCEEASHR